MAQITLAGAPDKNTVGVVGDIYIDSINGKRYELKSVYSVTTHYGPVTNYEWDEIGVGDIPCDAHTHDNKTVLDKLSENTDGNLLFNGSTIQGGGGSGEPGADGKSAYQIAVDLGFEGDEAAWLESLKGEKGETGEQGPQGPQGEKGADGVMTFEDLTEEQKESLRGPQGEKGDKGDTGETGPQGEKGEKGDKGDTGETGPEGPQGIQGEKGDTGETGPAGEAGKDGVTYTPQIGTVTTGDTVSASVDVDEATATATFNFTLPAGSGESSGSGEVPDGVTYVNTDESEDIGEIVEANDADTLGGRSPEYYVNVDNYADLVNVEADFLTSSGFGKLRFASGKMQYFNDNAKAWVDIQPTDDNALILNLAPQPMQKMHLSFDIDAGAYKITFKEPLDTIVDGQMLVCVEGIKFVRKLGSEPTSVDDGTLVLDYKRRNFASYNHTSYLDESFTANTGENWYYKAFPYSANGYYSESSANVASCVCKDYWLFGFKLDQNESDPGSMITYLEDCDNAYYEPAYMDYNTNSFTYGDWVDAWFIRDLKPVMLKYDGTVGYELMKSDYTKKADGTASDVANTSYAGNAMMGIPKVYWKIVDNGDDTANIYIASKQVDSNFHCWSHIDNNGNEIDYCYMPIYNGSLISGKIRSISGQYPTSCNQTLANAITYANANNTGSAVIWNTELYSDVLLIRLLTALIGKSTDSQKTFGNGGVTTAITSVSSTNQFLICGSMNDKGLFWGSNTRDQTGVKIFGMENWWGNVNRRISGWVNDKGTQKVKLTYGKSDGSTVTGYNTDGSGYITIPNSTPSGIAVGYTNKMLFSEYGLIPVTVNGSATTYYCDRFAYDNTLVGVADVGGDLLAGDYSGIFSTRVRPLATSAVILVHYSISCKPLATT